VTITTPNEDDPHAFYAPLAAVDRWVECSDRIDSVRNDTSALIATIVPCRSGRNPVLRTVVVNRSWCESTLPRRFELRLVLVVRDRGAGALELPVAPRRDLVPSGAPQHLQLLPGMSAGYDWDLGMIDGLERGQRYVATVELRLEGGSTLRSGEVSFDTE
jgi:hypothetical protein